MSAAQELTGHRCTACGQFVKTYRRTITSTMARWLIALVRRWQKDKRNYSVHEDWSLAINRGTGDVAKLRHWGLIAPVPMSRHEKRTTRTSGYWIPTVLGTDFVLGGTTVLSHVLIRNGQVLRFDGTLVRLVDCLGKRFDYDALMRDAL